MAGTYRGGGLGALQGVVAVVGLVAVLTGGAAALRGLGGLAWMLGVPAPAAGVAAIDHHVRHLGAIWAAWGLLLWVLLPRLERASIAFRWAMVALILAALARLGAVLELGLPTARLIPPLVLGLVVAPLLLWWQGRIATRAGRT